MCDNKLWKDSLSKVHAFVDKHVDRALAETNSGTDSGNGLPTRRRYILIRGMARELRDPIELRFQVINVFFPARDSTGIALSNALFNLARNPVV